MGVATISGTMDIFGDVVGCDGDVLTGTMIVESSGSYVNVVATEGLDATSTGTIENAGIVTINTIKDNTAVVFNGGGEYYVNDIAFNGDETLYTGNDGLFLQGMVTTGVESVTLTSNVTVSDGLSLSEVGTPAVAQNRIHRFAAFEIALQGHTLDLGNNAIMFNGLAAPDYKITSDRAGGCVTSSAYYTIGMQLKAATGNNGLYTQAANVTIANTSSKKYAAPILIWDDASNGGADNGVDLGNVAGKFASTSGYKIRIEGDSTVAATLTWTKAGTPATGQGVIGVNGTTGDQFSLPRGLAETSVSYLTAATIDMNGAETGAFTALTSGTATSALTATQDIVILVK